MKTAKNAYQTAENKTAKRSMFDDRSNPAKSEEKSGTTIVCEESDRRYSSKGSDESWYLKVNYKDENCDEALDAE